MCINCLIRFKYLIIQGVVYIYIFIGLIDRCIDIKSIIFLFLTALTVVSCDSIKLVQYIIYSHIFIHLKGDCRRLLVIIVKGNCF